MDLSETIKPKSDQLNADDLLTGPITVTIEKVAKCDGDQPVAVYLQGPYMPYKPCKSMRRVMIAAWGNDGREWAGKSMTLFCDPEVAFGGVKVGGIRISHMSDIKGSLTVSLTTIRSKRKPFTVEPLTVVYWSDAEFTKKLPTVLQTIADGKLTADGAIARLEKTARLTVEQRAQVLAPTVEQSDLGDEFTDAAEQPPTETPADTQNNEEFI